MPRNRKPAAKSTRRLTVNGTVLERGTSVQALYHNDGYFYDAEITCFSNRKDRVTVRFYDGIFQLTKIEHLTTRDIPGLDTFQLDTSDGAPLLEYGDDDVFTPYTPCSLNFEAKSASLSRLRTLQMWSVFELSDLRRQATESVENVTYSSADLDFNESKAFVENCFSDVEVKPLARMAEEDPMAILNFSSQASDVQNSVVEEATPVDPNLFDTTTRLDNMGIEAQTHFPVSHKEPIPSTINYDPIHSYQPTGQDSVVEEATPVDPNLFDTTTRLDNMGIEAQTHFPVSHKEPIPSTINYDPIHSYQPTGQDSVVEEATPVDPNLFDTTTRLDNMGIEAQIHFPVSHKEAIPSTINYDPIHSYQPTGQAVEGALSASNNSSDASTSLDHKTMETHTNYLTSQKEALSPDSLAQQVLLLSSGITGAHPVIQEMFKNFLEQIRNRTAISVDPSLSTAICQAFPVNRNSHIPTPVSLLDAAVEIAPPEDSKSSGTPTRLGIMDRETQTNYLVSHKEPLCSKVNYSPIHSCQRSRQVERASSVDSNLFGTATCLDDVGLETKAIIPVSQKELLSSAVNHGPSHLYQLSRKVDRALPVDTNSSDKSAPLDHTSMESQTDYLVSHKHLLSYDDSCSFIQSCQPYQQAKPYGRKKSEYSAVVLGSSLSDEQESESSDSEKRQAKDIRHSFIDTNRRQKKKLTKYDLPHTIARRKTLSSVSDSDDESGSGCDGNKSKSYTQSTSDNITSKLTQTNNRHSGYLSGAEQFDGDEISGQSSFNESKPNHSPKITDADDDKMSNIRVHCSESSKRNYCFICASGQTKIVRHWRLAHALDPRINKFINCTDKNDIKKLTLKYRNLGNHLHNIRVMKTGQGDLQVAYRPTQRDSTYRHFRVCIYCLGYYGRKEIWKHRKRCLLRPTNEIPGSRKGGELLLPPPKGCSERLKKVLVTMKDDTVGMIARDDELIIKFGEQLCVRNARDKAKHAYVRNDMRELARLLEACRKKYRKLSLTDLIDPRYFEFVVLKAKEISGFDDDADNYSTPSLPLKIGYHLKKCAEIKMGESIMSGCKSDTDRYKSFLELYGLKWPVSIGSIARQTLAHNRQNTITMLPLAEDVMTLSRHLRKEMLEAMVMLKKNEGDMESYSKLSKALLVSLILFNRRRQGEVSKMTLSDYHGVHDASQVTDQSTMSEFETALAKQLQRIEVVGKRGRLVPILLPQRMSIAMATLIKHRELYVKNEENRYVFATLKYGSLRHYRGSDLMRKFAEQCGAKRPEALRSTVLRKHVATMSQLVNLKDNELDVLASYMGHDIRIHREYYRLPQETMQVAKISKLLLALENGTMANLQGKSLDEIEIDFNEQLEVGHESEEVIGETGCRTTCFNEDQLKKNPKSKIGCRRATILSAEQAKPSTKRAESPAEFDDSDTDEHYRPNYADIPSDDSAMGNGLEYIPPTHENGRETGINSGESVGKKVKRKPWLDTERDAVLSRFQHLIATGNLPGKLAIEKLIHTTPCLKAANIKKNIVS